MDQTVDTGEQKVEIATEVKLEMVVIENKKEEIDTNSIDYTKCEEPELGRLVRSLHEKCPDCNTALQVRARRSTQLVLGVENSFEVTYKYCPKCHYEDDMEQKKRELRADRTAISKDDLSVKSNRDRRDGKDGYSKRSTTPSRAREDNRKSFRDRQQKGFRKTKGTNI